MTDALPLSELLTRRLSLESAEAVAFMRSLAERLSPEGAACGVPELQQIALSEDGTVVIGETTESTEPVRRLGQLLQALLADSDAPVQLRLIVSQATAPTPPYSTVTELDHALAYFERPDRRAVLGALYARARLAERTVRDGNGLTLDDIAPLATAKTPELAVAPRARPRHLARWAVCIVGLLALPVLAALYVRRTGMPVEGQLSRATIAAADAIGGAVLTGASAVTDRMGLGRFAAADVPDPTAADSVVVFSTVGRQPNPPVARAGPLPDGEAFPSPVIVAHDVPMTTHDPAVRAEETGAADPSLPPAADSAIYTTATDGVFAPTQLHAQLPRRPATARDPADLTRIEIVIARDGSVESARLLGERRDLLGGMFLSAVKAWKFAPAMKDGVAVRYRKTILVSFE